MFSLQSASTSDPCLLAALQNNSERSQIIGGEAKLMDLVLNYAYTSRIILTDALLTPTSIF